MKHINPYKNKLLGALCLVVLLSIPSVSYAQLDIWTPVGPGIAAGDTMFSIAVDPNFPDTIYVGSSSSRIERTFDGGANWTPLATFPGGVHIVDLIVHPNISSKVIAASDSGVFVSTDRGATWTHSIAGLADTVLTDLLINSQNPDTLFATGRGGVFRSLNLATSWASHNGGLSADSVNVTSIR